MSLYHINLEIQKIINNDELSDLEKQEQLKSLDVVLTDKLDNVLTYVYSENVRLKAIESHLKEQREALKHAQSKVDFLENFAKTVMQSNNITEIKSKYLANIKLVNNGGVLPLVLKSDLNIEELPEEFIKIKKEVNTTEVRACLEAGEVLDFAKLGERGKSIKFKG